MFGRELSSETSELKRMLLSPYLQRDAPDKSDKLDLNNKPQDSEKKIWVSGLLLLGVLYSQGSSEAKASTFFEIVQNGLNESIASQDKDISELYPRLLTLATVFVYHFTGARLGKAISEEEERKEMVVLDEIFKDILEKMLDSVFGLQSKLTRSEFIQALAGPARQYLDP